MQYLVNRSCPICLQTLKQREISMFKFRCSSMQANFLHFLQLNLICILDPSSIKWQKRNLNQPQPTLLQDYVYKKPGGGPSGPQCHQLSLPAPTETSSCLSGLWSLVPAGGHCSLFALIARTHWARRLSVRFSLVESHFSCTALGYRELCELLSARASSDVAFREPKFI